MLHCTSEELMHSPLENRKKTKKGEHRTVARMNSLLLHTVANWDSCMSTTGFSLSGKRKEWE